MTIDSEPDLAFVDGLEDVSYIRVRPAGQTVISVTGALRRSASRAESQLLPPGVALVATDVVWHLRTNALGDVSPSAGDMIATVTETWLVLAASRSVLTARWRVVARLGR